MSETSEELEARIAAYIDGQLPPAEAARLEVFLANTDPQLAEQIIAMLNDRHHLRSLPRGVAPPDLAARVMEQVERSSLLNDVNDGAHQRAWWQSRRLGAVAAVLMVGAFIYLVVSAVTGGHHDQKIDELVTRRPAPGPVPAAPSAELERGKGGAGATDDADALAMSRSVPEPRPAAEPAAPPAQKIGPVAVEQKGGLALPEAGKAAPDRLAATNLDTKAGDRELLVQEQLSHNHDISQTGTAEARRLGYTAVDSADKAIASLSPGSALAAREPVVVTLVARDEQDFLRLRQSLLELMQEDPTSARRQVALQNRVLPALANGYAANGNLALSGATAGTSLKSPNLADGAGNGPAMVGSRVALKDNEGNEAKANNLYQFYNGDEQKFEPATENNLTKNLALPNAPPANGAPPANASQAQVQPAPLANGGTPLESQQLFQQAAAPPGGPYRVELRPEQLRRLAEQFQVNAVTCGQQAFVIAAPRPAARGGEAARADSQNARRAEAEKTLSKAEAPPAPASAAAGRESAAEPQAEHAAIAPAVQAVPAATAPQASVGQASAGRGGGFGGFGGGGAAPRDGRWLECVITMEPQPAKEPAGAAPATQISH